jgi:hypothetical protein
MRERLLVNFFYAHPVGHAIEALHYANGHHAADPRTPSMTERRVREDLDRIIAAAGELVGGSVSYEQCLRDYFTALLAAHQGDASAIWSIDGVHAGYLSPAPVSAQRGR